MSFFLSSDLRTSISVSKEALRAVYNDPLMNRTPYHLHAVMVHQGEASGGHYWAYTRKHPSLSMPAAPPNSGQPQDVGGENPLVGRSGGKAAGGVTEEGAGSQVPNYRTHLETGEMYPDLAPSPESMLATDDSASIPYAGGESATPAESSSGSGPIGGRGEGMELGRGEAEPGVEAVSEVENGHAWMKFNDVSVSEVSWEEVRRESLGGTRGNTSAYCLVYVSSLLHQDWLSSGGKCNGSKTLFK